MPPRKSDIRSIVDRFTSELEDAVRQQVNDQFAARFDEFRGSLLGGGRRAPSLTRLVRGGGAGGRPGREAELKPCPVCGTLSKARRFSYLCPEHRTNENLAKFKGSAARPEGAPAPKTARAGRRKAGRKPARAAKRAQGRRGRKKEAAAESK